MTFQLEKGPGLFLKDTGLQTRVKRRSQGDAASFEKGTVRHISRVREGD